MKNSLIKYLGLFFIFFISLIPDLLCQSFHVNPLITNAGQNIAFDITKNLTDNLQPEEETYITWLNRDGANYSLYAKKISPSAGEDFLISSDTQFKSNPRIALGNELILSWQSFDGNYWKINLVKIANDYSIVPVLQIDSLINDPQIAVSSNYLAWIENGSLMLQEFNPILSNKMILDSDSCSSPDIVNWNYDDFPDIVYEKISNGIQKIFRAHYTLYPEKTWEYNLIAEDGVQNPRFGCNAEILFEEAENQFSKIKYSMGWMSSFNSSMNSNCNFHNPDIFTYPIPTGETNGEKTPFFIVFDSDSLPGNKEIMMQTFYYDTMNKLIPVSNISGDDISPKVTLISENDTAKIAIIWIHSENNKSDIWIAKSVYNPIISDVEINDALPLNFSLSQNYPNPFNPETVIEYSIPENDKLNSEEVKLVVFDILGQVAETLVDEKQSPGNYKIQFNAINLPSGIYFYQLKSGGFSQTRKFILLK